MYRSRGCCGARRGGLGDAPSFYDFHGVIGDGSSLDFRLSANTLQEAEAEAIRIVRSKGGDTVTHTQTSAAPPAAATSAVALATETSTEPSTAVATTSAPAVAGFGKLGWLVALGIGFAIFRRRR